MIRHLRTQATEPFPIFDCPAILALGVGLIAHQNAPDVRFLHHDAEAFAESEVAVLRAGDFDIAIARELLVHEADGAAIALEAVIEGGGEEAGFEPLAAQHLLLAEGDAFDGPEFLGVGGPIAGDSVGFEVADFGDFLEAHNGEGGTAENVLDEGFFVGERLV
jgi:hypothetical protein